MTLKQVSIATVFQFSLRQFSDFHFFFLSFVEIFPLCTIQRCVRKIKRLNQPNNIFLTFSCILLSVLYSLFKIYLQSQLVAVHKQKKSSIFCLLVRQKKTRKRNTQTIPETIPLKTHYECYACAICMLRTVPL